MNVFNELIYIIFFELIFFTIISFQTTTSFCFSNKTQTLFSITVIHLNGSNRNFLLFHSTHMDCFFGRRYLHLLQKQNTKQLQQLTPSFWSFPRNTFVKHFWIPTTDFSDHSSLFKQFAATLFEIKEDQTNIKKKDNFPLYLNFTLFSFSCFSFEFVRKVNEKRLDFVIFLFFIILSRSWTWISGIKNLIWSK